MSYKTSWFPTGELDSAQELINRGLLHHAIRFFPKMVFRRTVAKVKKNYDQERQSLLDQLNDYDWDSYVFFPLSLQDFILIDDQLKFAPLREARMPLLKKLEETVASVHTPGATVIEFGSGDGRNLLYLKTKFPDMKFVGFELSDTSVELSKAAAKKFGITGVEFYVADATQDCQHLIPNQNVVLCYSNFALEMMPRIFQGAVQNMLSLSRQLVVFFEPVDELWSSDKRGFTSKLRVRNLDRLRGLYHYLLTEAPKKSWTIEKAERSKIAINPFNEMVEIRLKKN